MRKILLTAALLTAVIGGLPAPACADAFWGGVMGAGLGGLLGSQFGRGSGRLAATGLGVATGALIGSEVGSSYSRPYYGSGGYTTYAAPYYTQTYVPNYVAPVEPEPRVVYVQQPVVVTGGYVGVSEQQECREYSQTTRIGGRMQKTSGMACLQPDGTWQLQ